MKTVIIYKSSTGFTKQYAEWIAERLNCETMELKKASQATISTYERVIYGGWIMGNLISGLDKVVKWNPKNLTVFAVGSSAYTKELEEEIKTQNHLSETAVFYCEGGFHYDKLSLPVKLMLKMMKKSLAKKEKRTEKEEAMLKGLGTSYDHSDKKYIEPLVNACM